MKALTVYLPDIVVSRAQEQILKRGGDIGGLCAGILSDHFLNSENQTPLSADDDSMGETSLSQNPLAIPEPSFLVSRHFDGVPNGSIQLAQAFVDEALKLPAVKAFPSGRGIGFKPNFVFIEYLMKRTIGISVSFYGLPNRHENPPDFLVSGIPSYSRAKIRDESELQAILPHIHQSYNLKFKGLR